MHYTDREKFNRIDENKVIIDSHERARGCNLIIEWSLARKTVAIFPLNYVSWPHSISVCVIYVTITQTCTEPFSMKKRPFIDEMQHRVLTARSAANLPDSAMCDMVSCPVAA